MKSNKTFWSRVGSNNPSLLKFSLKKQLDKKVDSLSYSIVEKRTPAWKPLALIMPMTILLLAFIIIPFFINFKYSFFKETVNKEGALQRNFTFEYFTRIITNEPYFAVGFRNSLIYGLLTLPFVISVSLLISSLIATLYRKWAKGFWQTIFFLPYMTNIVAVSLTFASFFSNNGGFNQMLQAFGVHETDWLKTGNDIFGYRALLPITLLGIWNSLAFNVLIFTTAMLSVDKNLYKSASIDGVGGVKQFFTITLPSIKGTISFIVTFAVIGGIKVFPLAIYQNNVADAMQNGASTLMLFIYRGASGSGGQDAASLSSAAAILLLVIGVTYSTIVRGAFSTIGIISRNLGEHNVWQKIKASKQI